MAGFHAKLKVLGRFNDLIVDSSMYLKLNARQNAYIVRML